MFCLSRLLKLVGKFTLRPGGRAGWRWPALRRQSVRRALLDAEELEARVVPTLLGQQLFPSDYPWNQNISNAPVAANSAAIIAHIGTSIGIHPDWGDDSPSNGNSPLYGIPFNVVHGNSPTVTKVNVIIDNYPGESDLLPVPIPPNAVIEGDYQNGPNPNGGGYNSGQRGDSHLIVWDEDNNIAYELYGTTRPSDPTLFPNTNGVELPHTDGLWHAAQETVWNMSTDGFRTLGDTSADAAGLSILAGLARPDEGLPTTQGGQGAILHALRFTLPSGDVNPQYIYPASHVVSDSSGSTKLPFGARLRLEDTPAVNAVINTMGPQAQIIAQAMQQYGLILADIGSPMFVTGTSASQDANNNVNLIWNMNDVLGLESLTAGDFQVVNLTPQVAGLSVSGGSAGSTITIIGQNFSGAAGHLTVFFGTTSAASVTYVDDSHITAVVPNGSGTVNVTVQSGVDETDPNNPNDNVNNPIFGYGTSPLSTADQFTFSSAAAATHFALSFGLPSYPGVPSAYSPSQSPAPASTFANTGAPVVFTVVAEDQFNNITPTYSGTVHFSSSDTSINVILPANTTLNNGVGTFSATLGTAGNKTLIATDTLSGSINGHSSAVVTRGLVVTRFTPTPTGFVIAFNKPFNPSSVIMYTEGTTPDDIMLATLGSQVSVHGSVLLNSPTVPTSITFVKTVVASAVGTFNPGSGLLSAGNYTVTLRSYSASTTYGFADMLGGALDGKDQANPGTNYVFTFSASAPPTAVGIPDFARGPSNTDAVFLPTSIGNGNTFNLIYNNPNTTPTTGTATVTFSTIAGTLQSNIQTALNALPQIGTGAFNVPNAAVVIENPVTIATQGANVLVTFQNSYFVTATNQVLHSITPGVSIALATINAANNQAGNGIPVALGSGLNVTSGSFTLQYNPNLLTISSAVSKIAGASFTLVSNNTVTGTAVLSLSSPTRISSTAASITLGSLLATVPFSATATYGAKQLLHFSAELLDGTAGPITVTNQDAVEVAAFFGDVNDTAMPFPSSGAVGAISIVAGENPNAIMQTQPGFVAFPNLDPVIIGEVNLGGLPYITVLDVSKMNQQLTVGQPTIPWLPAGLTVATAGADPTLSVVDGGRWTVDGARQTVSVPVKIDAARPQGSTSMAAAVGGGVGGAEGPSVVAATAALASSAPNGSALPLAVVEQVFGAPASAVDLQDSAAPGQDNADLAGLEVFFARRQRRSP